MALREQPYIPLYVMDFMTDEKLANCSAESTGVYIRLMCILHKMEEYGVLLLKQKDKQNQSAISNFASKLVRQMPYDVACIERSLTELVEEGVITIEEDRLYQKRMIRDNDISNKRAESGKKGGLKSKSSQEGSLDKQKYKHSSEICSSKKISKIQANSENENESESEYENDNEIVNESEGETKKNTPDRARSNTQATRFDAFWAAYPRKVGKGAALKSWQKVDVPIDQILIALEQQKHSLQWSRDNGQYIPYPATWINQQRWLDEPEASQSYTPGDTDRYTDPDDLLGGGGGG